MASAACDALHSLARAFLAASSPIQAIKCYLAACASCELPGVEADSRLQLARLLLRHTHNTSEARQHLHKALLLLGQAGGAPALHCEVLDALSECQAAFGEARLQREALEAGLVLCTGAAAGADRALMAQWAVHFSCRLAGVAEAGGHLGEAEEHLARMGTAAAALGSLDLQAVAALAGTQFAAAHGQQDAARARLAAAAALVDATEKAPGRVPAAQLRLHLGTLRALCCAAWGAAGEPDMPEAESGAAALEASAEAVGDAPWAYEWLPAGAARAAACLAAATLLRPGGRLGRAKALVAKARGWLDADLATAAIRLEAGERGLAPGALRGAAPLLALRALCCEAGALGPLTCAAPAAAHASLAEALTWAAAFPRLLAPLHPGLHMLCGHYAATCGCGAEAAAHFAAAATLGASGPDRALAAVNLAVAQMASGPGPLAPGPDSGPMAPGPNVAAATETLQRAGLFAEVDPGLPVHVRAAALLASGRLLLAQGDARAGKRRLTKALNLAHGRLANQQLVSQARRRQRVLNVLGPAQRAAGDAAGCHKMLKSSTVLATNLRDLHSQVAALAAAAAGDVDGDASGRVHEMLARHRAELDAALAAARAEPMHARILAWGLG